MSDVSGINPSDLLPLPAEPTPVQRTRNEATGTSMQTTPTATPSFAELLRARQGLAPAAQAPAPAAATPIAPAALRFSAHAQTRMQSRQISLQPADMDRLQGAVQRAANKGARDALVLMDNLAMVVSVPNRTVVTVVDKDNLKQNVFTNIDSAVIA